MSTHVTGLSGCSAPELLKTESSDSVSSGRGDPASSSSSSVLDRQQLIQNFAKELLQQFRFRSRLVALHSDPESKAKLEELKVDLIEVVQTRFFEHPMGGLHIYEKLVTEYHQKYKKESPKPWPKEKEIKNLLAFLHNSVQGSGDISLNTQRHCYLISLNNLKEKDKALYDQLLRELGCVGEDKDLAYACDSSNYESIVGQVCDQAYKQAQSDHKQLCQWQREVLPLLVMDLCAWRGQLISGKSIKEILPEEIKRCLLMSETVNVSALVVNQKDVLSLIQPSSENLLTQLIKQLESALSFPITKNIEYQEKTYLDCKEAKKLHTIYKNSPTFSLLPVMTINARQEAHELVRKRFPSFFAIRGESGSEKNYTSQQDHTFGTRISIHSLGPNVLPLVKQEIKFKVQRLDRLNIAEYQLEFTFFPSKNDWDIEVRFTLFNFFQEATVADCKNLEKILREGIQERKSGLRGAFLKV